MARPAFPSEELIVRSDAPPTAGERAEMAALGVLSADGALGARRRSRRARHRIATRCTRPRCSTRPITTRKAVAVLARHPLRPRRQDSAADLRHGQRGRGRPDRPRRRLPRAALAHLSQHHGAAHRRRRHLARHRPHHLLPARHRAGLHGLQRRPHGVLRLASARPAAGQHRAFRRGCAARICSSRSRPSR